MCLLKNTAVAAKPGINCSSLEMEDCNQTSGENDISTSSEQDCSVIVVDD